MIYIKNGPSVTQRSSKERPAIRGGSELEDGTNVGESAPRRRRLRGSGLSISRTAKGSSGLRGSLASRATQCARCCAPVRRSSAISATRSSAQARALGRGADGDSRRRGAASAPRTANDAAAVRRAAGVREYGALDAAGLCEALRQAAVRKKPSRPTHFETLILRPA